MASQVNQVLTMSHVATTVTTKWLSALKVTMVKLEKRDIQAKKEIQVTLVMTISEKVNQVNVAHRANKEIRGQEEAA